MGQVTHSILALPECPYPLLGRDFLAKMKAQIFFSDERAKLLHEDGKPVQILMTNSLVEEHRLHQVVIEPEPQLKK